jgi:hypothetical protein
MECQKEKVMAVSKVFHVLLLIVSAVAAVLGFMMVFAYLWSITGLSGEAVLVGDSLVTIPHFLRIGDTNLFYWSMGEMNAFGFGWEASLRTIVMVIALCMAERMFWHLKNGSAPFSAEVIRWFKYFAYAQVLLHFATNVVSVVFPFVLLAIVHVFEYGRSLQEESDTTL